MKALLLLSIIMAALQSFANCPEPRFIPFPDQSRDDYGAYMRVHPSGNFVLFTGYKDGSVVILDIRQSPPKVIHTPFNGESYPVEPDWNLIASPDHSDGMRYYSFADILKHADSKISNWDEVVKPVFSDINHNEFYHSSAISSKGLNGEVTFTTLLWHDQRYRNYSLSCNGSDCKKISQSKKSHLCEPDNVSEPKIIAIRKMRDKMSKLDIQLNKMKANAGKLSTNQSMIKMLDQIETTAAKREELRNSLISFNQEVYGNWRGFLDQPILSKDATEVAGSSTGNDLSIYSINEDGSCTLQESLNIEGGKANFSYPKKGKKGALTLYKPDFSRSRPSKHGGREGPFAIYVYDRDKKKLIKISKDNEKKSTYPGFTKDRRVIYRTQIGKKIGIIVAHVYDPQGHFCSELLEEKVTSPEQSAQ